MNLAATGLRFAYGGAPVLAGVDLDVPEGTFVGLVGRNGVGKSTALRCLAGAVRPSAGRVTLDGRDLATLRPAERARAIAVVPQASHPAFAVDVAYFVGMGRYAREPFLGGPTPRDREVVARCLAETGLTALAHRPVDALSGGEWRRVLVAQALAQEPRCLLLDEPVQQLDLRHQLEVMAFVRAFSRRGGTAALAVLHDLGLAARWCDRLVLLHDGRVLAAGTPDEVLRPDVLRVAYGVEVAVARHPATGALEVVALRPADGPADAGARSG